MTTHHLVNLFGIGLASLTFIPLITMSAERVKQGYSDYARLCITFLVAFVAGMVLAFY